MLHLILGLAGTGKTTYLRDLVKKATEAGEKSLVLVPEQYSFETEKAIFDLLGSSLSVNVEVLSFTRLANFIFRNCGGLAGEYLDDCARAMLMSVALEELQDGLSIFARHGGGFGSGAFVQSVVDTVAEFKNAGISPEELERACRLQGSQASQTTRKIGELALIYTAYQSLIDSRYADQLDDLSRACALVEGRGFFSGYTVFLDSFKGFMAGEFKMLRLIIGGAKDVYAAFCCDSIHDSQNGTGVFSSVQKTIGRLIRIASDCGVSTASPILLEERRRFAVPELAHLSQHFLRPAPDPFAGAKAIRIVPAANPYEEIEFVARAILRGIREENLRYRDFAVIGRSLDNYLSPIEFLFTKYGISYFMDKKLDVLGQPLPAVVLSALDAVRGELDTEQILRLAKSPLYGELPEAVAMLENYCYVWMIRGAMWEQPFQNHPDGFVREFTPEDSQRLQAIEDLRFRLMAPLSKLRAKIRACTGGEFAQAVYDYLESIQAAEHLKELGDPYAPLLWDSLMDILDRFVQTMEHIRLSGSRFGELLRLAFQSCDIAVIPQTADQVIVGTADRIRPEGPKAVFLIGVNQGIFPAKISAGGVLTESDRKTLTGWGLEVSETAQERSVAEKYFAYFAATAPSHRLYASYSASDLTGGALSPSTLVTQLERIFGDLSPAPEELAWETGVVSGKTAFEELCRRMAPARQPDQEAASLMAYLGETPYRDKVEQAKGLTSSRPFSIRDPAVARRLFGKNIRLSPSQVERFENCPFSFFCQYALKIRKRRKAELSPIESGSVIHYVLSVVTSKYPPKELSELEPQVLTEEIQQVLSQYLTEQLRREDTRPARFTYLYNRLSATLTKILRHLVRELLQSRFEPCAFELPIGASDDGEAAVSPMSLELPDGGRVTVTGIVDRVDILREGEKKYIRVVDYKTGAKKFSLTEVYYGLNLQMLLYLFTICQNGEGEWKDALPAGVLYLPARPSPVTVEHPPAGEGKPEDVPQEVLDKYERNFRMDGLILSDPEVVRAMEREVSGVFIPVKANKDGSFSKTSSLASLEELGRLRRRVESVVVDMAECLHQGRIDSAPLVNGDLSPCGFCDYREVCGQEDSPARRREMDKLDADTVFSLLEGGEDAWPILSERK